MRGDIRPRGPGSRELKSDLGSDSLTGRRITKYKTVRGSKRDAEQELRRLLITVDQGTHADAGKLTVGEYLAWWPDNEVRHSVSRKTLERYREIVEKHLAPIFGALPLGKLRPVHVQSYYAQALKSGRRDGKGGLSRQTVIHHDRVLHVAVKRARALRLIPTNPAEDVERPRIGRREIEVLQPDEFTALIKAATAPRRHTPIFLALATGLRRGALLALRWLDINLDRASLTVAQSLEQTKDGLRFNAPKTKRSRRTIALSPSAVEILQAHKVNQLKERMALGHGRNESGLVFTRHGGEPVNPQNFSKDFTRIVRRSGVRPITFHGLRHTYTKSR